MSIEALRNSVTTARVADDRPALVKSNARAAPAEVVEDGTDRATDRAAKQRLADMLNAEKIFQALAADEIELVWQPVRDSRDGDTILYHEVLIELSDEAGREASLVHCPAGLERLGFVSAFDREIVSRVIEILQADPTVTLGVNISAHSANTGGWWAEFAPILRANPGVAGRLVIEITDTAPFPSVTEAIAFVSEAQAMGCRVALGDFGVGHTSLRSMLAMSPAIIKIDALFVRTAASSKAAGAIFWHLVGLALSIGALVIVEGVETPDQAALGLDAGAIWQQGDFHGRPSRVRGRPAHACDQDDQARLRRLAAVFCSYPAGREESKGMNGVDAGAQHSAGTPFPDAQADGWAETGQWAEMGAARGIVLALPISAALWFVIWWFAR